MILQQTREPIQGIKKGVIGLFLFAYSVFLSFGNFFRFIHVPFFTDNLLLSEGVLYIFALMAALFLSKTKGFYRIGLFCFLIFLSTIYGGFLNGFEIKPFLYGIRLVMMVFCSFVLGEIFYQVFQDKLVKFLRFSLFPYTVSLVLGLLIYICFPKLEEFFLFLENYQIVFYGDPHIRRYVSVLFDPNMYAVVSFLPYLSCFIIYKITNKFKYLVFSNVFLLTVFLTWSRSGIATIIFLLGLIALNELLNRPVIIFGRTSFLFRSCVLISLFFCIFFSQDQAIYFLKRSVGISNDVSALFRFESFKTGLMALRENLFLGIGYNYLSLGGDRVNFIDSSLLGAMTCFGVVPFVFFSGYLFFQLVLLKRRINYFKNAHPFFCRYFNYFFYYLLVVILFSSLFNNILFYCFWLIPALSSLFYILKLSQALRRDV